MFVRVKATDAILIPRDSLTQTLPPTVGGSYHL